MTHVVQKESFFRDLKFSNSRIVQHYCANHHYMWKNQHFFCYVPGFWCSRNGCVPSSKATQQSRIIWTCIELRLTILKSSKNMRLQPEMSENMSSHPELMSKLQFSAVKCWEFFWCFVLKDTDGFSY